MSKGGEFERDLAKQFSLWWSSNKRDDIFYRTAASGGRATARMKKLLQTADSAGDMMAIDPSGKPLTRVALFEFKRGYGGAGKQKKKKIDKSREVGILPILDNPASMKTQPVLLQWFDKALSEMVAHGRVHAFIVFRRDFKQACICMTNSTYIYLADRLFKKYGIMSIDPMIMINCNGFHLRVFRLESFFSWCQPGVFTSRVIKRRKAKRKLKRRG